MNRYLVACLLLAAFGCRTHPSGGQWQPGSTSTGPVSTAPDAPSHGLITNTGGGEGQRGNDRRQ